MTLKRWHNWRHLLKHRVIGTPMYTNSRYTNSRVSCEEVCPRGERSSASSWLSDPRRVSFSLQVPPDQMQKLPSFLIPKEMPDGSVSNLLPLEQSKLSCQEPGGWCPQVCCLRLTPLPHVGLDCNVCSLAAGSAYPWCLVM